MITSMSGESSLFRVIGKLAGKINGLVQRVESISGKRPEVLAFVIYAVAHLFMAIFHEPWYDEAVAWQIARCASLRDILFEIPHYEGHPSLWHLILLPFAKLGAPYELSLSLVSLIFAGTAVGLIIWKSPFPRIVRLLLPFTYFFFYQYGVISRPYCVMMLAFVLLAMSYHSRNEKPGRYALSLMLLCLTSAYGIVIAGGLAIVWVWEIWNLQKIGAFLKTFSRDKRLWWLAALLALALLLIAQIMPREDTFATNLLSDSEDKNSILVCLLYMLFGAIPDLCITSVYSVYGLLQTIKFDVPSLVAACCLGCILWVCMLMWGKTKGSVLLLVIPYGMFAVFAASVYISPHHIGIGLYLLLFWLWVSNSSRHVNTCGLVLTSKEIRLITDVTVIFLALAMMISLYWSSISCIKDVLFVYTTGREEAAFIEKNNLDQYQIMVGWDIFWDKNENIIGMDINHCNSADNVSPYFEDNIFLNFNNGDDQCVYSTHKYASIEETAENLLRWSRITPDVLFMNPNLEIVYGDTVTLSDYTLVYSKVYIKVWKGISNNGRSDIYVRNDLAEELGLEEAEPDYPLLVDLFMLFR